MSEMLKYTSTKNIKEFFKNCTISLNSLDKEDYNFFIGCYDTDFTGKHCDLVVYVILHCYINNCSYEFNQYIDTELTLEEAQIEVEKIKRKWKLIIDKIVSKIELGKENKI